MRPGPGNSGAAIREAFSNEEILNAMKEFYNGPCGDKWPLERQAFFDYIAEQAGTGVDY